MNIGEVNNEPNDILGVKFFSSTVLQLICLATNCMQQLLKKTIRFVAEITLLIGVINIILKYLYLNTTFFRDLNLLTMLSNYRGFDKQPYK